MDLKEIIGVLAVIIGLYGYVPYVRGILRGEVHPHMFSWFIWGLVTWIVFVAQVTENGGSGTWITGVTGTVCLAIAAYSFRKGERNITKSDWLFFWMALAAIPLWVVTDNPLWSVILLSIIDLLGFLPTFRKSWERPWSESLEAYLIAGTKFLLSIAALEQLSMTTALFPITVVLSNAVFCSMLVYRRRTVPKPA